MTHREGLGPRGKYRYRCRAPPTLPSRNPSTVPLQNQWNDVQANDGKAPRPENLNHMSRQMEPRSFQGNWEAYESACQKFGKS